jgi:hypothetical protein
LPAQDYPLQAAQRQPFQRAGGDHRDPRQGAARSGLRITNGCAE